MPAQDISPTSQEPTGQRLIDYLRTLQRRWLVVVTVTVLVTGAALATALTSTKKYDATSRLLLSQQEPVNELLDPNSQRQSPDVERDINTQVEMIKLDTVANQVRRRLRLE